MNNNEKLRININLNGLKIPMNINRKDEIIYRDAEKVVKKYIDLFREKYAQYSMEEILTLVSFQMATRYTQLQMEQNVAPLAEKVEELNEELKALLETKDPTNLF